MKKLLLALWFLIFANHLALAQSTPGLAFGQVPTAAQWNSYFAAKQDVLGYVPLSTLGGTLSGRLNTFASSSASAGLSIPAGTAPAAPVDGDVWTTTAGIFVRINGSTIALGAGVIGTLAVSSGGTGAGTWTANLPLIGNGTSPLAQGTVTSTNSSTLFATFQGAATNGNCVSINANGNLVAAGGACTVGGGGGTVTSATIGQVAIYTGATTVSGITTCNNGYVGTDGSGINLCRTSVNATLSATIAALGTVTSGTWQATTIAAQYGGTGINNGASTITIGGNIVFSGAFTFTATLSASTSPTFPSGTYTLATQVGTSGGIPYYSSATTQGSTSALTANLPIFGGGAGTPPFSGTRSGNTTQVVTTTGAQTSGNCVSIDANGNHIAFGSACSTPYAVLLNTLTPSGVASTSDTTSITATYNEYNIVFENLIPAVGNGTCQFLVHGGGTFKGSGYISNVVENGSNSVTNGFVPCSGTATGVGSSANGGGVSGSILIYTPTATVPVTVTGQMFYLTNGSAARLANVGGAWWNAGSPAAIDGFQVLFGNGNIASGTIKVYGIK